MCTEYLIAPARRIATLGLRQWLNLPAKDCRASRLEPLRACPEIAEGRLSHISVFEPKTFKYTRGASGASRVSAILYRRYLPSGGINLPDPDGYKVETYACSSQAKCLLILQEVVETDNVNVAHGQNCSVLVI
jgi:hypothetical protein